MDHVKRTAPVHHACNVRIARDRRGQVQLYRSGEPWDQVEYTAGVADDVGK